MKTIQPLLGHFHKLNDLFSLISRRRVKQLTSSVNRFDAPSYMVPLTGLPGCVDTGGLLFVSPLGLYAGLIEKRMTLGVIGGFRCIRSAALMKEGKLPVFAYDVTHTVSILVATVDYSEHERFNRGI